ncbi:hypothetical protein DVR12_26905 [Chitinophaga silvatica]|uniref:MORN repeat variant n=1 Tax=Chitinophaga silvatica TaxID=2282649 RepID=A0A3E1Y1X4_9BACT|nr:hypothetical protein [Chitinophaga silvatica]RFS18678.1 hypothetical protein DVR12_26905 [Chitinophaga silvatica]
MRVQNRKFVLLILILLNAACSNMNKVRIEKKVIDGKNILIKQIFDENNKLDEEYTMNMDSVFYGRYSKFYPDGKLQTTGFYTDAEKDSTWIYYFRNGNIREQQNWFIHNRFGEQKLYYENGVIRSFEFLNLSGGRLFLVNYDSTGQIVKWEGAPIYIAYNSSSLKAGDEFQMYCFVGGPEGVSFKVRVQENKEEVPNKISSKEYSMEEIHNLPYAKKVSLEKRYKEKGRYLVTIIVDYYNDKINRSDSSSIDLSID